MADKLTESLFLAASDFMERARQELSSVGDAPQRLGQTVDEYWTIVWDALSQQGRLPMPSLPSSLSPSHPPPPPPPTLWQRVTCQVSEHKYKYLAGGLGLVAATAFPAYYYFCAQDHHHHHHQQQERPFGIGTQARSEAVLLLGADPGTPGHALAKDLALRKGFIVIATVSSEEDVHPLEREASGWIKALVLNPVDVDGIPAFAHALSSTLSLRFPLRSAGDPYVNSYASGSSRSLLLSGIINALPLSAHFEPCPPIPLEATSLSTFSNTLNGTLTATLGVIQAVLPLLRNTTMAMPPSHSGPIPPAVLLTLIPAPTANVALPFVGGQSAADAALLNMMDVLRRELRGGKLASSSSAAADANSVAAHARGIKFASLDVGFFEPDASCACPAPPPAVTEVGVSAEDVPPHLAFYLPAMSRRTLVSAQHGGNRPNPRTAVGGMLGAKRGVPFGRLADKVTQTITKPSKYSTSSRSSIGAGAITYRLAARLPDALLDAYFAAQDYIASFLPLPKLLPASALDRRSRLRKPLPHLPQQSGPAHPASSSTSATARAKREEQRERRASPSSGSEPESHPSGGAEDMASSNASLASLQSDSGASSQAPSFGQSEYVQL